MKFQYYEAAIQKSTPLGEVTLDYMLNAIRSPKHNIRHIFEQISLAEQNKDMALKAKLKTKLYSFTPCVYVNGTRKYSDIVHFTGLMVLDFDHLESVEYAIEFKNYFFNEYRFVIASWLSPSKHGVKCILNIPICNTTDEFKQYFNGLELIIKSYKGYDDTPKNCILPLFLSYDEDILIRYDYTTWNRKHTPMERPIVKQYIIKDKSSFVENIIIKKIDAIINNGHPQLRAAAYLLGGYCGGGHIDYDHCINMINHMIDGNSYLCQKASRYKKTAKQMIDKGISMPVYL